MASFFSSVVGLVKSVVSSCVSMVERVMGAVFGRGTPAPVPEMSVVADPLVVSVSSVVSCVVAPPVVSSVVPAVAVVSALPAGVLFGRSHCAAQAQEFAGDTLPAARYGVLCTAPVCSVLPTHVPPPVPVRRSGRVPRLPVRYTDVPVMRVEEPVLNAPPEVRTRSGRVVRRPDRLSY